MREEDFINFDFEHFMRARRDLPDVQKKTGAFDMEEGSTAEDWASLILLAVDGAMSNGFTPRQIVSALDKASKGC